MLEQIPKNLRLMYVHSWQSYIWNRLVSERIKLFGASAPVEGDLVYAEEVADDEPIAAGEDGDEVANEAPSVNANAATPAEAAAANPQLAHFIATSSVPKVHALTAQDIESGKYTIQDVVLPMPGFAVQYPAGQLGEVYRRVIREDGINPDDMWRKQKEYSLVSQVSLLAAHFFRLPACRELTRRWLVPGCSGRHVPQDSAHAARRLVPVARLDFAERGFGAD